MNEKWNRRFLELAEHVSTWSKDPSTKIGAVIADKKDLISVGFNGFPKGVGDYPARYEDREVKYKHVVHAEVNACLYAGFRAKGATIYVSPALMAPNICNECAKVVIQSGIKRVVSWSCKTPDRWWDSAQVSSIMLEEAGVKVEYLVK
jgi:dCMP deaminase